MLQSMPARNSESFQSCKSHSCKSCPNVFSSRQVVDGSAQPSSMMHWNVLVLRISINPQFNTILAHHIHLCAARQVLLLTCHCNCDVLACIRHWSLTNLSGQIADKLLILSTPLACPYNLFHKPSWQSILAEFCGTGTLYFVCPSEPDVRTLLAGISSISRSSRIMLSS